MFIADDEEVESENNLLDVYSQFTSKTKRRTFCLPLQQAKCSADQENAGEGSEILERGVSRIFKEANKRIYGQWDTTASQTTV